MRRESTKLRIIIHSRQLKEAAARSAQAEHLFSSFDFAAQGSRADHHLASCWRSCPSLSLAKTKKGNEETKQKTVMKPVASKFDGENAAISET